MGRPATLTLQRYEALRRYVDVELVRREPRRKDPEGKVRTALAFNAALGDPQRCAPAVQVAGTSGKGSVAALIAAALDAAGLRTGLHVSPYLQSFSEKTWISGRYAAVEDLERALARARPVAERFRSDPDGPASVHGMTSLALSYLAFAEARVSAQVIETGVGGRYDLVQGLDLALAVVTDLGLDHLRALGATLEEIAWHKAGVLRLGVPAVAVRGPGWEVLAAEAERVGAPLEGVDPARVLVERAGRRVCLRLPALGEVEVELSSAAPFLARNAAVAASALDRLARAGWPVGPEALREGFARRVLPGRCEAMPEAGVRVVLDGAHNPQKLGALLEALDGRPLVAVVAATGSRTPEALVRALAPRVRCLVVTELGLYGKESVRASALVEAARERGLVAWAGGEPACALERALEEARAGETVLVTGSLYLLGAVRGRWYPTEEVIRQRTSWPAPRRS
ncbi:MAG: hypothetical protein D6731_10695 [Planctomycetota bacterium]|nr:MAG: hypothetical protein D6731_10695 [Planctomycetota bacterium]